MNCGATEIVATEETQVTAEIIALECIPRGSAFPLFKMPARKFRECVAIIPLGVN